MGRGPEFRRGQRRQTSAVVRNCGIGGPAFPDRIERLLDRIVRPAHRGHKPGTTDKYAGASELLLLPIARSNHVSMCQRAYATSSSRCSDKYEDARTAGGILDLHRFPGLAVEQRLMTNHIIHPLAGRLRRGDSLAGQAPAKADVGACVRGYAVAGARAADSVSARRSLGTVTGPE